MARELSRGNPRLPLADTFVFAEISRRASSRSLGLSQAHTFACSITASRLSRQTSNPASKPRSTALDLIVTRLLSELSVQVARNLRDVSTALDVGQEVGFLIELMFAKESSVAGHAQNMYATANATESETGLIMTAVAKERVARASNRESRD